MRASEDSSIVSSAVALVGPPNAGKTTLYNWLTGSRFKTVNYPGATVEYSLGHLAAHLGPADFQVMDTPGTYSLHPKSSDEWVTVRSLYENPDVEKIKGVVLVIDGTQLARHLLLALQLKETGFPMVVVVTMADLLRKEKVNLDLKFLQEKLDCPVLAFDGLLAGGLQDIVQKTKDIQSSAQVQNPIPWNFTEQEKKIQLAEEWAQQTLTNHTEQAAKKLDKIVERTEALDRFLLHPIFGVIAFLAIMTVLFSAVYWAATPFMDFIENSFVAANEWLLTQISAGLFADFITEGVVTSFAAFLVFVPQIFILFFGMSFLESTGYLARAATIIDRPFAALGMSGRSFVPILSGFACAIPAIIATRNIPSKKDRLITSFVIPLMSCSARLPVYALCLSFLFKDEAPWKAGLSLAALYLGSIVVGALAAGVVNRIISKTKRDSDVSLFMMELPIYRRPSFRVNLRQSATRTYSYIKRAGPIIFVFAVLVWVGSTFPNYDIEDSSQKLQSSYIGSMGHAIEPLVEPMGLDWRAGVGLISAFAAREVFVSSMAVTYSITAEDEGEQQLGLIEQMKTAKHSDGTLVFTVSSVLGLMVFFLIALQCMSTVAVQAREMRSWKFALTQLVAFNLFAYVLVVLLVQGLRFIGIS